MTLPLHRAAAAARGLLVPGGRVAFIGVLGGPQVVRVMPPDLAAAGRCARPSMRGRDPGAKMHEGHGPAEIEEAKIRIVLGEVVLRRESSPSQEMCMNRAVASNQHQIALGHQHQIALGHQHPIST